MVLFILLAGSTLHADESLTKEQIFNLIADADHRYTGSGPWPDWVPPRWSDYVRIKISYLDDVNTDRSELDTHLAGLIAQVNSSPNETFPQLQLLGEEAEANVIVLVGSDLEHGLQEVLRQPERGWIKLVRAVQALPPGTCVHVAADTRQARIVAGLIYISTTVPIELQAQCASSALLHIIGLKGTSEPNLSLKSCISECFKLRPLDLAALNVLYAPPGFSDENLSQRIDSTLQK